MQKLLISFVLLVSVNVSMAVEPPPLEWQKTYGGNDRDFGHSVQQTNDGGYIIAGSTYSYGAGSYDVWLIKTDADGNDVWKKTFGGSNSDSGSSVQQTSDGGYVITGFTASYGGGGRNVWLIKTDADGNDIWKKTFGGSAWDSGHSVQQTSDGGYIIAGETASYGAGALDVWLIKTDADGNDIWKKTFGGSAHDVGYSVQQTSDGGYIITGNTHSFGAGSYDVLLIKTDADGNNTWDKTFGGSDSDSGYSVQQTSDGGYVVVGETRSAGVGDVWLIKTDADGNDIWQKTFGGSAYDIGKSVQQTSDGGYIIAGTTSSYGIGDPNVWLIKTDADGNDIWKKTFGTGIFEAGQSVQQTSDGGYIITGDTWINGADDYEVLLIKTEADFVNQPPVANAGPNQVAYALIDGFAEVILDGNDSYDPDGDELTYFWSWTIDSNIYEANGVSPTIELPIGQHTIELIVNDGINDSEPDYVIVEVIEPIDADLKILPRAIVRHARQKRILAQVTLPEDITKDMVDANEPLILEPGEIESYRQFVVETDTGQVKIFAFFRKRPIMTAVENNGPTELTVTGWLKDGRVFYGTDTVRIRNKRRRPFRSRR